MSRLAYPIEAQREIADLRAQLDIAHNNIDKLGAMNEEWEAENEKLAKQRDALIELSNKCECQQYCKPCYQRRKEIELICKSKS